MSELGDKIKRKVHRTIETIGFIVGLATMEQPPKKPDDDERKPPPPVPTSTKSFVGQDQDRR